MWCHLGPLLIVIVGGLLTCGVASMFGWVYPLIAMNTTGQRSSTVREHAVESLNFQLSFAAYNVIATFFVLVFGFVTFGAGWVIGLPLALGLWVFEGVVGGMASSQASNGGFYRYPTPVRLVH